MCHFGYYIYVMLILVLLDLSTLCAVDHLQLLILYSLLSFLSTLWFVCTNSVSPVHYVPKFIGCHKAIVVYPVGQIIFMIQLVISSCYGSVQYLIIIGRDGGLSTLCHSCGFACQQKVLKTFPGTGLLSSADHQVESLICLS